MRDMFFGFLRAPCPIDYEIVYKDDVSALEFSVEDLARLLNGWPI
jgi:hypothetical protein